MKEQLQQPIYKIDNDNNMTIRIPEYHMYVPNDAFKAESELLRKFIGDANNTAPQILIDCIAGLIVGACTASMQAEHEIVQNEIRTFNTAIHNRDAKISGQTLIMLQCVVNIRDRINMMETNMVQKHNFTEVEAKKHVIGIATSVREFLTAMIEQAEEVINNHIDPNNN